MKRILLLASLIGATTLGSSAFAYNYVFRSIPETSDAAAATPAAATAPYAVDGSYEIGAYEAPEANKLFSGSIVGSWADGFGQSGNRWNMNQVWLTSEREVSGDPGRIDLGYRVDALFGTNNLQSSDGFDGKWGVSGDG
ncbi:MAG: hypothetical protein II561_01120, partial [Thermoguttaceae bacterium]|nr:hypothetical protein [Thermoguttaceae bacterium]